MSKLLVNDYAFMVQPSLAAEIGLNEAILLQQIHYWLQTYSTVKNGRKWVYNTYEEWQKQIQFCSVGTIKRAMRSLEKQGFIITDTFNKHRMDQTKWYTINYDKIREFEKTAQLDPMEEQIELLDNTDCPPHEVNLSKAIPKTTTKTTEEDVYIPFSEIIDYLNAKTNATYKPTTKKTQQLIRARWQEGFRLADFYQVIDIKATEWLQDAYWSKYLRPETLFGTKFEAYLNQKPKETKLREEDFDLDDEA